MVFGVLFPLRIFLHKTFQSVYVPENNYGTYLGEIPRVKFSDGNSCPIIGLGTWQAESHEITEAVKCAIQYGYRHIDCALFYGNEKDIGKILAELFRCKIVSRGELFITSKLWNTHHRKDLVEPAIRKTLSDLGVNYLDLYLVHWPFALKEGDDLWPTERGKLVFSNVSYLETWKAMEELFRIGLTKSIGVSNFNCYQLDRLLQNTKVPPVVNQVECHPYLNQQVLLKYCRARHIKMVAYSPLGSPGARSLVKRGQSKLLEDDVINSLAEQYEKTPAQIALRYQVQRGIAVIPKSVTPERIKENFDIFNFYISLKDMCMLDRLNKNLRYLNLEQAYGHDDHPFEHFDNL